MSPERIADLCTPETMSGENATDKTQPSHRVPCNKLTSFFVEMTFGNRVLVARALIASRAATRKTNSNPVLYQVDSNRAHPPAAMMHRRCVVWGGGP